MKPIAYRVKVRGDVCSISGVAQSARGTKFLTRTLRFDRAGLNRKELRAEVLKTIEALDGTATS